MEHAIGELTLARELADRDALTRENPLALNAAAESPQARFIAVSGEAVAVNPDGLVRLTRSAVDVPSVQFSYLGQHGGEYFFAADLTAAVADDTWTPAFAELNFVDLRTAGWELSALDTGLATTAVGLTSWQRRSKFCFECGAEVVLDSGGWRQECTHGHIIFPRTDPAVIMAIRDGEDRLLLGRNRSWKPGAFSTLAGFVESGEPLEAAVRREVMEEAGIEVGRLDYFGSQPWPFPRSLMVAFRGWTVEKSPQVKPDNVEVVEAFFVTRDELIERVRNGAMLLPGKSSVARALIEDWFGAPLASITG